MKIFFVPIKKSFMNLVQYINAKCHKLCSDRQAETRRILEDCEIWSCTREFLILAMRAHWEFKNSECS